MVGTRVSRSTAWLEKACAERFNRLAYLKMDPVWRGLHDDPRFDHTPHAISE